MVPIVIHSRRPNYACAHDRVPSRDIATEYTPKDMRCYGPEALRRNAPWRTIPYAALQLMPRNLDDIPPIADTSTGP
eukprot:2436373-Pleurochrysis_carterae.AAC.1